MVYIVNDKATVAIPARRAGLVAKRMFAEGQLCPVGKVLITIDVDGPAAAAEPPSAARQPGPRVAPAQPGAGKSNGTRTGAGSVLATPATRKLARDLGVDIREVVGSGRGGRVTSDDVRTHGGAGAGPTAVELPAARPPAPAAGDVRVPFRGVRKKIAENLVRAKHTAAHYTYVEEVDCTELVTLRRRANERLGERGVKLSFLPFVIKATVAALQKFPQLNATLDEAASEIVQRRSYHIGLATATESGLIVPVVRDADKKTLAELAREIDRLAAATRSGKAARDDLTGS